MLSFQITIIIIIIIFFIILLNIINTYLKNNKQNPTIITPIIKYFKSNNNDLLEEYDRKKINDTLEAPTQRPSREELGFPLRLTMNNKLSNLPNNYPTPYPTRGYPDNYHLLGTLSRINNNDGKYNPIIDENNIIKLYGRRKYPGSYEYEYYTNITTGNDMTKIPITYDKKLFTNDKINIPELNGEFNVNLYPNEELKYNPFLF